MKKKNPNIILFQCSLRLSTQAVINPHITHRHGRHVSPKATQPSTIPSILHHHPRRVQVIHVDSDRVSPRADQQAVRLSGRDIRRRSPLELIPLAVREAEHDVSDADPSIVPVVAIRPGRGVGHTEDEATVAVGGGVDGDVAPVDHVVGGDAHGQGLGDGRGRQHGGPGRRDVVCAVDGRPLAHGAAREVIAERQRRDANVVEGGARAVHAHAVHAAGVRAIRDADRGRAHVIDEHGERRIQRLHLDVMGRVGGQVGRPAPQLRPVVARPAEDHRRGRNPGVVAIVGVGAHARIGCAEDKPRVARGRGQRDVGLEEEVAEVAVHQRKAPEGFASDEGPRGCVKRPAVSRPLGRGPAGKVIAKRGVAGDGRWG